MSGLSQDWGGLACGLWHDEEGQDDTFAKMAWEDCREGQGKGVS